MRTWIIQNNCLFGARYSNCNNYNTWSLIKTLWDNETLVVYRNWYDRSNDHSVFCVTFDDRLFTEISTIDQTSDHTVYFTWHSYPIRVTTYPPLLESSRRLYQIFEPHGITWYSKLLRLRSKWRSNFQN